MRGNKHGIMNSIEVALSSTEVQGINSMEIVLLGEASELPYHSLILSFYTTPHKRKS